MKIGFEAKRIFQNNTGLGNYSRTLVSSLVKYFPTNEYFLFAPKQTSQFTLTDENKIQNFKEIIEEIKKSNHFGVGVGSLKN